MNLNLYTIIRDIPKFKTCIQVRNYLYSLTPHPITEKPNTREFWWLHKKDVDMIELKYKHRTIEYSGYGTVYVYVHVLDGKLITIDLKIPVNDFYATDNVQCS